MRLVSVQSYEKLACMNGFLEENTEYWTSGTNSGCKNNRFRWCSPEFNDFVKQSEYFNESLPVNAYKIGENNMYCVKAQNFKLGRTALKVESCEKLMKAICEVRVLAESYLQEIYNECKLTHQVSQRDISKFNTTDVDSFSYKMKCFSTCMAELLGLMYDGSKFWEERIEKLLSTFKMPQVVYQDFREIANKFSLSLLKRGADNLDTLQLIYNQQSKEKAWKSTLFVTEALDRFWECNQKMKDYNSKGECSFIHDFIKCFTNKSDSLEKFWNKDFHDIFDPKDYSKLVPMDGLDVIYGMIFNPNSDSKKSVEVVNKISYDEEVISSGCTYRYLRPKILTFNNACSAKDTNFVTTPVENILMYKHVNNEKRYPPLVAAAACARANGSLVTVTDSNVASMKILNRFSLNATKSSSSNDYDMMHLVPDSILLDETYLDSGNVTRWCSTSEEVPNSLFKPNQEISYYLYLNYNVQTDAMFIFLSNIFQDENLCDVPTFFCAFDKSFLTLCKKSN
ncbi:uncharacterized protein LOC135946736 [Cloeon dipterum]|uniref:uncharacterized protein LOC135946736 n=1 Tax=Cloeon dipterum TaxID=197152 RepID=UPI00322090CE